MMIVLYDTAETIEDIKDYIIGNCGLFTDKDGANIVRDPGEKLFKITIEEVTE